MKKLYLKTILFEVLAVVMTVVSINIYNQVDLYRDDWVQNVIMSFVFTLLFGVCIDMLCIASPSKNNYSKSELYIDAVIRIGLSLAFSIWNLAMAAGIIRLYSYIMVNYEAIVRCAAIMIGVNIVTGIRDIIMGHKIPKAEKPDEFNEENNECEKLQE
ncbi:MAG: hypothetical protein LUE88_03070 [Clostridiales bacterium]|nr:hypothetical protein [Clostridiales bacterium]